MLNLERKLLYFYGICIGLMFSGPDRLLSLLGGIVVYLFIVVDRITTFIKPAGTVRAPF